MAAPRPTKYRLRVSVWHQAAAVALVLVLATTNNPCLRASEQFSNQEKDAIRLLQAKSSPKDVEGQFKAFEEASSELKTDSFDPEKKAAELGRDAEKIFEFVRDAIQLEIYSGVLRGPRGTLMAGAGNSYDKSLLLAELLRRQGFTCRFARVHLPLEATASLVAQMLASVSETRTPKEKPEAEVDRTAQALLDLTFGRAAANLEIIGPKLAEAGIKFPDNSAANREQLSREASDHLWVEYKQDQNWVALDATPAGAKPGKTLAPASKTFPELPAELQQTVTLSVSLEERAKTGSEMREVLRHTAPAAELHGAPVTLHFETSAAAGRWTATPALTINGKRAGKSSSFSSATSDKGVSGLATRMFQKPGVSPQPDAAPVEISAMWLEAEFGAPSTQSYKVRRTLFDRVEDRKAPGGIIKLAPITEKNEGIPDPLRAVFGLSFDCGKIAVPYLLSQLRSALPQLKAALAAKEDTSSSAREKRAAALRASMPLMAASFHAFSDGFLDMVRRSAAAKPIRIYHDRPRLAMVDSGEAAAGFSARIVTSDLRQNRLRVVGQESSGSTVPYFNLICGVLDGALEGELFGDLIGSEEQLEPVSLSRILRRAKLEKVAITALQSVTDLDKHGAPEFAKRTMRVALENQAILVTPRQAVMLNGHKRTGWWQIDPSTGAAVAAMDTGLFQTSSELPTIKTVLMREYVVVGTFINLLFFGPTLLYLGSSRFANRVDRLFDLLMSGPASPAPPVPHDNPPVPQPSSHPHDNPWGP